MGGYLVYCVCLFVCTVTGFAVAEKDNRVKLCVLVRLLSGMSFSHFGELWPRGSSPRSLSMKRCARRGVGAPYGWMCILLLCCSTFLLIGECVLLLC